MKVAVKIIFEEGDSRGISGMEQLADLLFDATRDAIIDNEIQARFALYACRLAADKMKEIAALKTPVTEEEVQNYLAVIAEKVGHANDLLRGPHV